MNGVVLVTGVMAAGKSTVAQALAERLPGVAHVRGDVFRRMIVSGRREYTPGAAGPAVGEARARTEAEAQLRLRYRLSAATADEYARAGFTAVVQDVILGPALPAYVETVRTRPLHVVVLAPDADTVAAREAAREKKGYGADWTVAALDAELRARTPRIGLWLDTTELTVGETVEAILAGRQRARVI
ncbi:AAA family ATPase [Streptomyces sp. NPDC051315]|uniref:AAA family ATPase n=1 Tax=Streptomyces sp. NPDC051315 TaxID=3365650 RepID=UPI0037A7C055